MSLRRGTTLLLLILLLATALPGRSLTAPLPPDDTQIVRVYVKDQAQEDALLVLGLDLLEARGPDYLLALTGAKERAALQSQGYQVVPDDRQNATLALYRTETYSGGYRTVDEVTAYIQDVVTRFPNLAQMVDYGDSWLKTQPARVGGHDLWALRLTNQARPGPKPVFFLMAAIHARELSTTEMALNFIKYLVEGYGNDADATWLLDWNEIWIVPASNPDGRVLAEQGYYQRKNLDNLNGGLCELPPSMGDQYGTDLNRNASFKWSSRPPGASNDPCSQVYAGPAAASEPEEQALEALMRSLFADQRGPNLPDPAPETTQGIMITLHSFGGLVLWPWGFTTSPAPNMADLKRLGDKFATYNGYDSCQPGTCLYYTTGTTDDWAYGTLGIPSFTFEIGDEFFEPYGDLAQLWQGNFPALVYAAKVARMPYKLVRGPDALQLAGASAPAGFALTISATISDAANGGDPIAAAEAYVDTPPWAGGTPLALSATDGAFDETVETVQGPVSALDAAPGWHLVFVRGQDANGNWGPVSALFVEMEVAPPTATPTATLTPTPKPTRRPRLTFPISTSVPNQ
jgi:carboxypeptidase T